MENETTNNTTSNIDQPTITKKDPKKVEQGKRLAAISKEAKERKLRQKIENELREENSGDYSKYLVPVAATVGTFVFFYMWFSRSSTQSVASEAQSEASEAQREASKAQRVALREPPPKKFESFVE